MQSLTYRVDFLVSTPVQVEMFSAVIASLDTMGAFDSRLITLEHFYSYPGLRQKVLESHIPFAVLGDESDHRSSWAAAGPVQRLGILFNLRRIVAKWLHSEHLQLLVLGTDINRVEQVIIHYANECGVPTLLVSEGVVTPVMDDVTDRAVVTPIGETIKATTKEFARGIQRRLLAQLGLTPSKYVMGLNCTRTAVIGEQQRNLLIEHGVEAARVEVTGQPRFDRAFHIATQTPHFTLADLGIADGRGLILFAGYLPSQHGRIAAEIDDCMLSSLVALARNVHSSHYVLIRPHPSEHVEEYKKRIGANAPSNILITKEHDLYDILRLADLLVTNGSTVIVESLIFSVPVLIFQPSDLLYAPHADFETCGVAYRINDIQQIEGAARTLLYGTGARQAYTAARAKCLSWFLGSSDGRASERVAALITTMVVRGDQVQC